MSGKSLTQKNAGNEGEGEEGGRLQWDDDKIRRDLIVCQGAS